MPDYCYVYSFIHKPLIHPTLFAMPLTLETFRKPTLISLRACISWTIALLGIGGAISTFVFWLRAGDALFDGLSIPIAVYTLFFFQAGVAGVVLGTAISLRWANRQSEA